MTCARLLALLQKRIKPLDSKRYTRAIYNATAATAAATNAATAAAEHRRSVWGVVWNHSRFIVLKNVESDQESIRVYLRGILNMNERENE